MNILKSKKGLTLLELILAVAIFAIITMPLLSIFLQSISIDKKAENVLNANYISQDYIEKLDTFTYSQALSALPDDDPVGDYTFTAKIIPYGTLNSLFGQHCSYVHLIMFADGSALSVMPDGKWHIFSGVPSTFSLSVSNGTYSFTGGYTTLTGSSEYNYCAMVVNAMKKPDATKTSVTLGANCKAALYIKDVDSGDITFSGGSSSVYENLNAGDKSLVYVTTSLYDPAKESVATSDSYLYIRNW